MNCIYCEKKVKCKNEKAKNVWAINQRNGWNFFNGELIKIDWKKAIPIGARPITFSK